MISFSVRYVLLTIVSLFILSKLTLASAYDVEKSDDLNDLISELKNVTETLTNQVLHELSYLLSNLTGKPVVPPKGDFAHKIKHLTTEIVHRIGDLKADDPDDPIQGIENIIKFLVQAVATISQVVTAIAQATAGVGSAIAGIGGAGGSTVVAGVGAAISGIAGAVGLVAGAVTTVANFIASNI